MSRYGFDEWARYFDEDATNAEHTQEDADASAAAARALRGDATDWIATPPEYAAGLIEWCDEDIAEFGANESMDEWCAGLQMALDHLSMVRAANSTR